MKGSIVRDLIFGLVAIGLVFLVAHTSRFF